MITALAAVLFCSAAAAVPAATGGGAASSAPAAPAPSAAPSVPPAPAARTPAVPPSAALGVSTYTVSTLYTGDRVRDPFLAPSAGGGVPVAASARARDRNSRFEVDIHALQLHGIMKDSRSDFAIFSGEDGSTLILRGDSLYDGRGKRVPGITGRIQIRQKRAELMTADKDVQVFSLGEAAEESKPQGKDKGHPSGESSSDEP